MDSKIVLITGTSSGIGAGIAPYLASIGYKKLVLVARRLPLLEEVAAKCKENGAKEVLCLSKDLMVEAGCKEAIQETVEKFGGNENIADLQ